MSDLLSIAGAALLTAALLPQAWHLLRSGTARGFHWGFVALNLGGLVLLAMRSGEIGEPAFLAVNLAGTLFWLGVFVVKAFEEANPRPATPAGGPA